MRKLVSPMSGKILKINVKVGQVISEDDEVLVMQSVAKTNDAKDDCYHNLYEYSINESLDLLARLIDGNQMDNGEEGGVGI